MPRKKLKLEKQRNIRCVVLLTKEEERKLQKSYKEQGFHTVSDFVRSRILR